jgi:hypothetical protein
MNPIHILPYYSLWTHLQASEQNIVHSINLTPYISNPQPMLFLIIITTYGAGSKLPNYEALHASPSEYTNLSDDSLL